MTPFRNLLRNRLRTSLTLLGAAGAIALLISIRSVTGDIEQQIQELTVGYGAHVAVMQRNAATPLASKISTTDLDRLAELAGSANLVPLVFGSIRESWCPYLTVVGAPREQAAEFHLNQGRVFSEGELMLGRLAAERSNKAPGDEVTLAGRAMRVSGIFALGSRLIDGGVLVSLEQAQQLLGRGDGASVVVVRLPREQDVPGMVARINSALPHLQAMTNDELVGQIRLVRAIRAMARALAAVALIIAAIILSNTLLMATSERNRELAILMAIGWPLWRIWRMILAEAIVLCAAATLVGWAASLGLLALLNRSAVIGWGWIPTHVPISVVGESAGLAVLLAVTGSIYPAVLAAGFSPAEVLRHE